MVTVMEVFPGILSIYSLIFLYIQFCVIMIIIIIISILHTKAMNHVLQTILMSAWMNKHSTYYYYSFIHSVMYGGSIIAMAYDDSMVSSMEQV